MVKKTCPKQLHRIKGKQIDQKRLQKANEILAPKIRENQRMLAESSHLGAKFFAGG